MLHRLLAELSASASRVDGATAASNGSSERTIVTITHSLERGLAIADRVVILANGRVAYEADARRSDAGRFPAAVRPVRGRRPDEYSGTLVGAIVWKDVRAELRTKDIFSSMFVFALLSVIVFNFAFQLRVPDMKMVLPGIVWVAVTFAGTLGLNRAFVIEQDKGSLAGLLLAPMDRSAIYFGKMLGNLLFMLVVEASCCRWSWSSSTSRC